MGLFERFLSLWVALCIVTGVFLGSVVPEVFRLFASIEYAGVNVPVAIFIWVMIFPMVNGFMSQLTTRVIINPFGRCPTPLIEEKST